MYIWVKPTAELVKSEEISNKEFKVLSIESSLYASGCHSGMHGIC